MFCKNCGKQIPDNTKFCNYCGAQQVTDNNMNSAPNQQSYTSRTTGNPLDRGIQLLSLRKKHQKRKK